MQQYDIASHALLGESLMTLNWRSAGRSAALTLGLVAAAGVPIASVLNSAGKR